jgi:hypothetical protein
MRMYRLSITGMVIPFAECYLRVGLLVGKGKVKVVPVPCMKTYGGSGRRASLILNRSTR